ncbi:MAG: molybdopterin-dependent oxidoreductase, partial [Dehalococcoidia bacterium]|nr:molybdopterin-dependent oxidoreductase [Dehalococcoidia bacterium]
AEETQLDIIAKDLGLDPVDMRLKNAVHPGDVLLNKSRVTSCGFSETIGRAVERSRWRERTGQLSPNKGIGMACSPYISGFYYGLRTSSAAFVKFNEEGQATVFTGNVDNGQGNRTMMAQVVAEELGLPLQAVTVVNGDTQTTPMDPGSHSMSATTTSANAVRMAASDARRQLLAIASEQMEANAADLEVGEGCVFVRGSPGKSMTTQEVIWAGLRQGRPVLGKGLFMPPVDPLDWVGGRVEGQMTSAYTFGTAVAEVEVDPDTGQVHVERVTGAHDCGRAINPLAVEASIQGSLIFGQGQALSEAISWEGGQPLNPNFADYGLSSALESPHVESIIVETSEPNGPYGAKGAAETLNIAIVPAIANAIYDAVGVRVTSLPITPEKVLKALEAKQEMGKA